MKIVVYGLTITSAWGNGHATTYRSLIRALARLGHRVTFVEKDLEWYRSNRDLTSPDFCRLRLYDDWQRQERSLVDEACDADAVVIGSYFPDAIRATRALLSRLRCPLLFYDIDTPVTLAQLRDLGRCDYLDPSSIPYYAAYLSFTGGPALQLLESAFGSPRAVAMYCSVDADFYAPRPVRARFRSDLSYLGTYASDRQPKLLDLLDGTAALLPDHSFLVAGAMYPPSISWKQNVRHLTHVAPPDHPGFYSSARFTLNLTRADMVIAGYSPSVRLFEASACGAAILSDAWPGIAEFLTPGEEILLPRNAAETADILMHLSETERITIGQRARDRILAEHTSTHRARQFEHVVSQCAAPLTSPRATTPRVSAGRAQVSPPATV